MILPGPILVLLFFPLVPIGAPAASPTNPNSFVTTNADAPLSRDYPWKKPLLSGPIYSIRELAWRADLILRVEPGPANTWKILEVLQKAPDDPTPLSLPVAAQPGNYPRTAREWIGFWQTGSKGTIQLPTGIRAKNAESKVWIPGSADDLGDYDTMLAGLRLDINAIRDLKHRWISQRSPGDPLHRQKQLWEWANAHESQFGGGIQQTDRPGWGSLEQDLLAEILPGPDDTFSWNALNLYARTNDDQLPPLKEAFDSTSRRDFLLKKAVLGKLSGERIRAIRVLGNPAIWSTGSTDGQWERLGDILKESVNSPITELANAGTAAVLGLGPLKRLDPALAMVTWERYQAMPLGNGRAIMAAQLARVMGQDTWKKLTGNEAGMVVGFEKLVLVDDKIQWTLVKKEGAGAPSKLELVREKIDEKGQVKEVLSQPLLEMGNPPWSVVTPLTGEWAIGPWPVGLWRIRVESKGNPAWKSEPRVIKVSKPVKLPIPGFQPLGTNNVIIDAPIPKTEIKTK